MLIRAAMSSITIITTKRILFNLTAPQLKCVALDAQCSIKNVYAKKKTGYNKIYFVYIPAVDVGKKYVLQRFVLLYRSFMSYTKIHFH